MPPTLVAVAGPLTGIVVLLDADIFSIGRGPDNQLIIPDLGLSRSHCRITAEGPRKVLRDLESLNGCFVNGLPVKERVLEHGDQIRIGDSVLLFVAMEGAAAEPLIDLRETGDDNPSTILLRPEDILYFQSEQVLGSVPSARLARDLHALVKVGKALPAIRDCKTLVHELLDEILEVVPADCGAILLTGDRAGDFTETYSRCRQGDMPVPVSKTIVRRVLADGISVLSNDVQGEFGDPPSAVAGHVYSALCVPLIAFDRTIGVIFLATTTPAQRMDPDHLQLVTAIAGVGALALDNLSRLVELQEETSQLQSDLRIERSMVGESPRLREVYAVIARAAPTDSTVLILGESGTGKELAARAIHDNSPRHGRPFVAVNCAALTESLLESELFGYEKGAFTGAMAQRKGRLETAHGGTVFLDEIGELAPNLQVKLLRVLQQREFERVGGTTPVKVDIRVVAATNRQLDQAVRKGTFRSDLYYRLNVVSLTMPPLRERRDDIPLLAAHFVAKYARRCKRRVTGLSASARTRLMQHDWPGNVRELENAIERAIVLGASEKILAEDLPEALLEAQAPSGEDPTAYHAAIREAKKRAVIRALKEAEGSYQAAARLLGLHPNNLHRLIRTLGLKAELARSE